MILFSSMMTQQTEEELRESVLKVPIRFLQMQLEDSRAELKAAISSNQPDTEWIDYLRLVIRIAADRLGYSDNEIIQMTSFHPP